MMGCKNRVVQTLSDPYPFYFLPNSLSLSLGFGLGGLDQPFAGLFVGVEVELDPLPEVWTLGVVRVGAGEKTGDGGRDEG